MQEEMHEQMSGYKRMRREHQAALIKVGAGAARRGGGQFAATGTMLDRWGV